jgi:hypothetical protein
MPDDAPVTTMFSYFYFLYKKCNQNDLWIKQMYHFDCISNVKLKIKLRGTYDK